MTGDWNRMKPLFQAALEVPPERRTTFLWQVCDDADLRIAVESLLESHQCAEDFLERPGGMEAAVSVALRAPDVMAGRRIGLYRIVREIGEGGMGAVYLATRDDDEYRKEVAIKIIRRDEGSELNCRRFRQERQILADLDHPNIARLIDGGTTLEGVPYLVMELVDGVPLDIHCQRTKLSIDARLELFRQVCGAVAHAHERGVVHRDLKPSNLLVTRDGNLKLLDFGIAKLLDNGTSHEATVAAARMLTPEYASPEQVCGEPVTVATDVYSLGVLLYRLLTGRSPYRVATDAPHELARAICEDDPPRLSTTAEDIQPAGQTAGWMLSNLDAIVFRAMRKSPAHRYASVGELSEDVRRHQARLPVTARLSTWWDARRGLIVRRLLGRQLPEPAPRLHHRRPVRRLDTLVLPALIAIALTVWFIPSIGIDAVAVLPFESAPATDDVEYVADGVTEDLIKRLSQLPGLKVTARGSVFRYKGRQVDPQTVGRDLGVRAILTGRVMQLGPEVTIDAELTDARDGGHVWSRRYRRQTTDLHMLQQDLARDISTELRPRIGEEEMRRVTRHAPTDAEAYRLYLKGRFFWNKRNEEGYGRAIQHFQRAIARQPSLALAYAGLADVYNLRIGRPQDRYPQAKAAALKAIEIDPSLGEPYAALGVALCLYDWDWSGAERAFRRAIELNPNYASAYQWYGLYYLATMRRFDDALAQIHHAQGLDPLSLVMYNAAGAVNYLARRYEASLAELEKALEMNPDFAYVLIWRGRTFRELGRSGEALADFEKTVALSPDWMEARADLAVVLARLGRRDEARRILAELPRGPNADMLSLARAHVALGENEEGLAWIEKAFEERRWDLPWLRLDPAWDALRSDLRFETLLRRVGLPS